MSNQKATKIIDRQHRLKAAEEFVKKIPQPFQRTLTGPSGVKKFFTRQEDAIRFAAEFGNETFVFSFETEALVGEGARRFLVTTAECFWHEYKQIGQKYKHYYEVIPEGVKCRLYCDLEYYLETNPNCDGEKMTKNLVDVLIQALHIAFDVEIDIAEVIVLDSCYSEKFSKHLIFISDCATFQNNFQMGAFMRSVHRALEMKFNAVPVAAPICSACMKLVEMLSQQFNINADLAKELWVTNSKGGPSVTFCDLGVYTRNRNFRLMYSSKLGKHFYLKKDVKWPISELMTDEQLFLCSLVTNTKSSAPCLSISCTCQRTVLSERVPCLNSHQTDSGETAAYLMGYQLSPYAEVDSYICQEILGHRGRIRRWFYFRNREILSYDIIGNRFCRNIGREHRSNNVIYVVDLSRQICYQKCLDPSCKQQNYKSEEWPLPAGIMPWDRMLEEMEKEDDQLLANYLENTEKKLQLSEWPLPAGVLPWDRMAEEKEKEDDQLLANYLENTEKKLQLSEGCD